MLNRVLVGAAVIASALLTDVAAKAFPGHKRAVRLSVPRQRAPVEPTTHRRRSRAHHHRHTVHHKLSPPAQAPTPAPATTSAPPPAATQAAPAPAPAPSPAPVVSGGS